MEIQSTETQHTVNNIRELNTEIRDLINNVRELGLEIRHVINNVRELNIGVDHVVGNVREIITEPHHVPNVTELNIEIQNNINKIQYYNNQTQQQINQMQQYDNEIQVESDFGRSDNNEIQYNIDNQIKMQHIDDQKGTDSCDVDNKGELDTINDKKQIMQNQPTINIGMIGSVSNGKSSITEKLTGVKTQRHSNETKENRTIKLGYANVKIYRCESCPAPECYQPHGSGVMEAKCKLCSAEMILEKHVSIVDCPGHNTLMATMLNGTCVMDKTVLVEAANKAIPSEQTKQHLMATGLMGLENAIICLNKIDLVKRNEAEEKMKNMKSYFKDTMAEKSIVVPVAANYGLGIDVLCEYLCRYIDEPVRDLNATLKMIVVRSFNVNKQDINLGELQGGVIGGSIVRGKIAVGDRVVILPICDGNISKSLPSEPSGFVPCGTKCDEDDEDKLAYWVLKANVISICSEKNPLDVAYPGGLIGVQLTIDPGIAAKDGLVGCILTLDGDVGFKVYRILFVVMELNVGTKVAKNDKLRINANACDSHCKVNRVKKMRVVLELLNKPICVNVMDYITLSNQFGIIGRGQVVDGIESHCL